MIINISSCEDVSVRVSDSAGAQPSLLSPDVEYFTEEIILNTPPSDKISVFKLRGRSFYVSLHRSVGLSVK